MSALYRLKAYGECEALDIDGDDMGVVGAEVVEQEPSWLLEVVIRAESEDAANVLADAIMDEAKWNYGGWHQWHVEPIGGPS